MKGFTDIRDLGIRLDNLPHYLAGSVEAKYNFAEEPTPEQLEKVRETATNAGFQPEEDTHELEGRHMLTLTWHF